MSDTPWTFTEESQSVSGTTSVTLVHGASFVICDRRGDIPGPGAGGSGVDGLFVGDTRVLSMFVLTIDGRRVEPLAVSSPSPRVARMATRTADRSLLVLRDVAVGGALRSDIEVRNLTNERRTVEVTLKIESDLADLFAVKEGRATRAPAPATVLDGALCVGRPDGRRGAIVRTDGARLSPGMLEWTVELDPRETWSNCVEVSAVRGGHEVEPHVRCGHDADFERSLESDTSWQAALPRITSDVPGLSQAVEQAGRDLDALRIVDADHPDDVVVAAGAPWFMTLFGRDSLITAWMALVADPQLALSTVRVLARLQGQNTVPETEEQPGRILHEVRFGRGESLALEAGDVYYGSVDATPLFVMLVGELRRWGVPMSALQPLLPAVDSALRWIAGPGDPDGDGFVEYQRMTEAGLVNQGWKDSFDGVSFADGRLPTAPVALCEVQGYAYAAWCAGAELAEATGAHAVAAQRSLRAEELRARFNAEFWLADQGAFAIALDSDKRPVDAIASNMGHCLWTGIADHDKAEAVARWLVSPKLNSGWGLRTLATSMARFNPLSYHNGSVWPHDTSIAVAGLRRAGFVAEAQLLAQGLLAAAVAQLGRLPELFAGLTPQELDVPVAYPASCAPQAWASAAPLLIVRSLLGLEPDVPRGVLQLNPALPPGSRSLRVDGLRVAGTTITIEVENDALAVSGLPPGLSLVRPAL
ncbi:MAG: amylo-alpha-1,6-glucosidase [Acidimicrobiales bacterium]